MGGNARYHTAVIRNADNASGFQEMRDANGDLIRIRESKRVVGRNQRTSDKANARERMLNARALGEIRNLARTVRSIGNIRLGTMDANKHANTPIGKIWESNNALDQLATLANQIEPGSVDAYFNVTSSQSIKDAFNNIERILGVKIK